MSVQSDVHGFLAAISGGAENDWVPMDPGKVAEQVGTTRNKVNKTLFNLTAQSKIELQRGANGRNIVGFKLLAPPPPTQKRQANGHNRRLATPLAIDAGVSVKRARRTVHTPNLDQYAKAKERFQQIEKDFGDLVHAEFQPVAYAEEGLQLRDRLDQIEDGWHDMSAELEQTKRELNSLQRSSRRELREAVERSGQTVEHGD